MALPRACGGASKPRILHAAVLVGVCLAASLISGAAAAAFHRHHWQASRTILRLSDPEKDAALILDGETGKALYARNADALRHPASLTKMMTLYLLFDQLKSGQMSLATPLYVSAHAAAQARTKLNLRAGSTIPVDTAIKAIVVLSANDVAVTIAEAIGGSEPGFAQMMTAKARALGMSHTYYDNASGLPDPLQITTANDLALLARHLAYDFPQYFHYFSTYSFGYRGATYFTHDNLIGRYQGADGIKTGYTNASGFNLVSSVVRSGVHIIGVVMGGTTARRRDSEMVRLLDDTFAAIGKNPQLAARADIPWQAIAQNGQKPVIAGFQFGSAGATAPQGHSSPPELLLRAPSANAAKDDEDAAESRPDPLYESEHSTAAPPPAVISLPHPAATPPAGPPARTVVAAISPQVISLPSTAPASSPQPALATIALATVPLPEPKPRLSVADYIPATDPIAALPGADNRGQAQADGIRGRVAITGIPGEGYWTVQIGAFGDATLARAKLAAYAQHATDVLGRSARIVTPFQSVDGRVLYRARFGPFVEREARQVCETLTKRGQTCFAAVASR